MDKISVLIVDHCAICRVGMHYLLSNEADIECIGEFGDGETTIKLAKKLKPDVVVVDFDVPRLSGIEIAEAIKKDSVNTAIIILDSHFSASRMIAALRVGAAAYLSKHIPPHEIGNAIRSIHAGEAVFDFRAFSGILPSMITGAGEKTKDSKHLGPRELQILDLVAKGLRNRQIAEKLFVSERTIQTHLSNIFRKMEVSSRIGAVLLALKQGWLTDDDLIKHGTLERIDDHIPYDS